MSYNQKAPHIDSQPKEVPPSVVTFCLKQNSDVVDCVGNTLCFPCMMYFWRNNWWAGLKYLLLFEAPCLLGCFAADDFVLSKVIQPRLKEKCCVLCCLPCTFTNIKRNFSDGPPPLQQVEPLIADAQDDSSDKPQDDSSDNPQDDSSDNPQGVVQQPKSDAPLLF